MVRVSSCFVKYRAVEWGMGANTHRLIDDDLIKLLPAAGGTE